MYGECKLWSDTQSCPTLFCSQTVKLVSFANKRHARLTINILSSRFNWDNCLHYNILRFPHCTSFLDVIFSDGINSGCPAILVLLLFPVICLPIHSFPSFFLKFPISYSYFCVFSCSKFVQQHQNAVILSRISKRQNFATFLCKFEIAAKLKNATNDHIFENVTHFKVLQMPISFLLWSYFSFCFPTFILGLKKKIEVQAVSFLFA